MVVAETTNGVIYSARADDVGTLVIVLDETAQERQFDRKSLANGTTLQAPTINEKVEGLLSKEDIELILRMFDTGISICFLYVDFISYYYAIACKLSRHSRSKSTFRHPTSNNLPRSAISAPDIADSYAFSTPIYPSQSTGDDCRL